MWNFWNQPSSSKNSLLDIGKHETVGPRNVVNSQNQPSSSKYSLLDVGKHETVGPQNVDNSHSEFGCQYNICGNNNSVSVSSAPVKSRGLEVQVSEPVASFCGRGPELQQLHGALQQAGGSARRRLAVLCGPGGIGKTQCARAYIRAFRAAYSNVVWLLGETERGLLASFQALYAQMGIPTASTPHDVYGYLNSHTTLFVFDNAQDMNSISPYLPRKDSKCLFLITSQVKNWSPHVSLELGKLDENCAVNVLNIILTEHRIFVDTPRLMQLAQRLDRIPLVLQISAGFICQQVLDLRSMNEDYDIDGIFSELENEYVVITANFPDFFDCNDYLKSVYVAVLHTLEKVWSQKSPVALLAADALGIAAYLNPEELNLHDFKALMNIEDDKTFKRAWALLLNYSLIQKCSCHYFTLHRSIQQCLQIYFIENKVSKHYETVLNLLLQNDDKGYNHYSLIFQQGLKYYNEILNFYKQYSLTKTFKVLTYYSNDELLALLVRDLNLKNNFEFLYLAAMSWSLNPNIMQILIDNGTDVHAVDEVGNVLHHLCCSSGFNFSSLFYACCMFIKLGVSPKIMNSKGQTAIDIARCKGNTALANLLESMNTNNIAHLAAKNNLFGCLVFIYKHKLCKGNEQDEMGNTVLHALCSVDTELNLYSIACRYGRMEGVELGAVNAAGETAADVARRRGHADLAELLQPGSTGPRDLYVAAKHGNLQAVRSLTTLSDEYVTYRDELGQNPLHMLCSLNKDTISDEHIIDTIKESNLYKCLFLQNNDELSPFQWALINEREQLAEWLQSQSKEIIEKNTWYLIAHIGNQIMQSRQNPEAKSSHDV